ncbi:MAG: type II secretion system minor pseudopilin GspI [Steroidobacteraceae bacterium]|nr:type II secretion system minor pseudopilin GspI [Steroidobacteraceae bacterium]
MSRARGFTLIEVLVALVIVAVGMAALLGTLSSAADSSIYLRDKTFAEWIALNRVSELRLAAKRPSKGRSSGEIDYAGRKWRYEQDVVETDIPGVLRIDVKVADAASQAGKAGRGSKPKDEWTVTASGVVGDALGAPNGVDPDWNGAPFPGEPSAAPGNPDAAPSPAPAPSPSPGGTLPTR